MSGRVWRGTAYLPALAYAAALLYVGTRPQLPGPPLTGHLDKVAHFSAYAVLGALLAAAWIRTGRGLPPWLLVGAAMALGMIEEVLQSGIVGREGDVLDWLADSAGAATGFLVTARVFGARSGRRGE